MLLRRLAVLAAPLVLAACLVIEEGRVDVSALDSFHPALGDGAVHEYCAIDPAGQADCQDALVTFIRQDGASWVRLTDPAEADKPLDILFVRAGDAGEVALLRIAEPGTEGLFLLALVEPGTDGLALSVPACGQQAPEGVTRVAALNGATVEDQGCSFADTASLMATAAAITDPALRSGFGRITLRR